MAGQTPQLAIVQVNDTVPGTVPRISGPSLVLTSNGTGDAATWATASGSSSRLLAGLVYVDPTFGGTATGSANAPFASCAAALAGTSGNVCLLLASGTYSEAAFTIPNGRVVRLQTIEESGQAAVFSNRITWSASNFDELQLFGLVLSAGLGLKDADGGTGNAYLFIESCQFPSSAGISNQNPATAPYSHSFNLDAYGRILDPFLPGASPTGDCEFGGAVNISGVLSAEKTLFGGAINGATQLTLRGCGVQHSATWGEAIVYETFFSAGITITQAGGVHLYADALSYHYLQAVTYAGGVGSVQQLTPNGERWTLGLDALDQLYGTDATDVLYYAVEPTVDRVALIAEPTASGPRKMRVTCGYAAGTHTVTPRRNSNGSTFSIAGRSLLVGPRSGDNPFVDLQYINGVWQAVATAWNP